MANALEKNCFITFFFSHPVVTRLLIKKTKQKTNITSFYNQENEQIKITIKSIIYKLGNK